MILIRRSLTAWQISAFGLAILVTIALPGQSRASRAKNTRLLVYLEVPRAVEAATELSLGGLALHSLGKTLSLEPSRDVLVSTELAGRQILLVSASVPPGAYSSLHLRLEKVVGQVGVAPVTPLPPPDGVEINLDLELRPATCEVVFLEWRPAAIDDKVEFHAPDIRPRRVNVPPLGSLAFVTCRSAGAVMIIDRLSGRVVGARWVDDDPKGMAFARAEQALFVALSGQDGIGVLDGLSLRLINTVPLQFGDDPTRLLLSRDQSLLFVLSPGSRTLTVMSTWSLQQQFRIPVGEEPRSLVQDPVTGFVYVACEGEGTVQVIDSSKGTIINSLTLAPAPVEVAVDPQSRRLFVGGSVQRRVHYLDLGSDGTSGDQNLCGPISGLVFNPRTQKLYAGIPGCKSLAVVRPESGLEFASVNLPSAPGLMSFDREFRQLLVVLPLDGSLAVCNPNRGLLEHLVQVGDQPFQVLIP
jgi:DNA-binding beta-propeller fold protein YncE